MTRLPVGEAVPGRDGGRPDRRVRAGTFVVLEPIDPELHAEALWRCSHGDPRARSLWTYLPYGPFADAGAMREWLAGSASSDDPLFFAVVDRAGGDAIGMVSDLNVDPAMRRLEIGHIWYGPAAQRSRANTEAVALLLREAFDELGYRRVEWKCDALNRRSRAAALRLGFTFEGVFRKHMIVKGRNRDTAWYSMLDDEWPSRREHMDRWLAAEPGTLSLTALNARE